MSAGFITLIIVVLSFAIAITFIVKYAKKENRDYNDLAKPGIAIIDGYGSETSSDDVSFCVKSREEDDPYWMDSSLFMENGYIYLVDECDMTAEKITDDYCWFKAKSVSYQVLPD